MTAGDLVPPEILQLKELRGDGGGSDCESVLCVTRVSTYGAIEAVNYAEYNTGEPFGYGNLIGRIK